MSYLGDPTNTVCPRSCPGEVVYNGNYFCDTCDWSAPDGWIRINVHVYAGLMEGRAKRKMVAVEELINFDVDLYERGAL